MSNPDDVCVVTQPISNASESHVLDLLEILGAITSVSLLTANLSEESEIRDEFEVIDISNTGTGTSILVAAFRFIRNQFRMANEIRQREESIVLFFGATSYLLPIIVAKLSGKKVVLEPRGNVPLTLRLQWEQRVPSPIARVLAGSVWLLERTGYRLADAIITYTPAMAEELGLTQFDSKLHTNGARYVDVDKFYPRTPFEERRNIVGFLGRLDEEKNVRLLAEVAKDLPEDVTFRFLGEGPLREELEHELAEAVASGEVEFIGWVDHDDVPVELSELQLLVLPSEATEGLPTVILESMACGTPMLATPVSGVPDVVKDGETGFLIRGTDSETIAEEIVEIIDQEGLSRVSRNGKQLVEREYSFEGAVGRYDKILNEISERNQ